MTLALSATLLVACGGDDDVTGTQAPTIEHVHGLGVNPADGALFIATHSGLFRLPPDGPLDRVGESTQDTMGFTVVGPDRFLGSGHPGPGEDGPPNLGLISSEDAGQSWQAASLTGEVDFHLLRYSEGRLYGIDAGTGALMLSADDGQSWRTSAPPSGLIDIAVDPADSERLLASTSTGLQLSEDGGTRWRAFADEVGFLAWPEREALFLVGAGGQVEESRDGGKSWVRLGNLRSQPAAFAASDRDRLYAALVDGTVLQSTDAGQTWDAASGQ